MTAGLLLTVWKYTHLSIWEPLITDPDGRLNTPVANDVYCELFREASRALLVPLSAQKLADIIDDPEQSRAAFLSLTESSFLNEEKLVSFAESCFDTLYGLGGEDLANYYFSLLDQFVLAHNLRYEVRQPCVLCPTLTGVFAMLVQELKKVAGGDAHLNSLLRDFESSVRDLRTDSSDTRIKTCIQKQFNLLEALGRSQMGVSQTTLGAICDQLAVWPHSSVRDSVKSLYKFGNDYPGIRHGGTASSAVRAVDMRDLIAMAVVLVGFTPYLESRIQPSAVYGLSSSAHLAAVTQASTLGSESRWKKVWRLGGELVRAAVKG